MKRSPIKRNSKSPAKKYERKVAPDRNAWAAEQEQVCWVCGRPPLPHMGYDGLDIHEIQSRATAPKNWGWRCNYLLTHRRCHDELHSSIRHPKALALKWLYDRPNFSLSQWIRIRYPDNRAPERVTAAEVAAEVLEITEERPALNGQPLSLDTLTREIEET